MDLDMIEARAAPPDSGVIADENVEERLLLLDAVDKSLRMVAALKADGLRNLEIAGLLGLPLWAIERKLRRIREIWREHDAERNWLPPPRRRFEIGVSW
jgi:hypothetical protein